MRTILMCLCLLWSGVVGAKPVQLGVSGLFGWDEATWTSMDAPEKIAFLQQRLDVAEALGATSIRLGTVLPHLFGQKTIDTANGYDWTVADAFIGMVSERNVGLVATLPDLIKASALSPYGNFVEKLVERYDGDTDFAVDPAAINKEFPDIDGSGSVTVADWDGSNALKQSWADAHRIQLIEVGSLPKAAEDNGVIEAGDYGKQLAHVASKVASGDVRIVLGMTQIEGQAKSHFVDRLEGLDQASNPFQIGSVSLSESFEDLSGETAALALKKFGDWLKEAGYPDTEKWVGSLRVASSPSDSGCEVRCSERTQVGSLVRGVFDAIHAGYTAIHYGSVIGEDSDSARLLSLRDLAADDELLYGVRPVFAVWQQLASVLAGVEPEEVTEFNQPNPNIRGFKVGDAGWIFWYNWTREVGIGEPYGGKTRPVRIEAISAPALSVMSLWPESVGETWAPGKDLEVSWATETIPVSGGTAEFQVGQDPVWVSRADDLPAADTGSESDAISSDTGGDAGQPNEPADADSGGGCTSASGTQGPPSTLLLLLLAAYCLGHRRGRSLSLGRN